ncbi:unnamed protein product [Owenia fusiformis]|uniref:Uncharacterized protein n=1 Tax=Owenia fusiformis TaxID=6347 RepID=A0A8J1T9I2_OWEFU|nr:unnamed protein product [Owenia fusiformis]
MMIMLMNFVATMCLIAGTRGYKDDKVDCFDCNYSLNGMGGFGACSLKSRHVFPLVDTTECDSKTCFIRKDPNGYIYRGCADQANLPLDVDTTSGKCTYQGYGPNKSLWYFCSSHECNNGFLEERCSNCV